MVKREGKGDAYYLGSFALINIIILDTLIIFRGSFCVKYYYFWWNGKHPLLPSPTMKFTKKSKNIVNIQEQNRAHDIRHLPTTE